MTNSDVQNFTPHPTWDYYIIWHKCVRAKAKIELALTLMSKQEDKDACTDLDSDNLITDAINQLSEIDFELEEVEEDEN